MATHGGGDTGFCDCPPGTARPKAALHAEPNLFAVIGTELLDDLDRFDEAAIARFDRLSPNAVIKLDHAGQPVTKRMAWPFLPEHLKDQLVHVPPDTPDDCAFDENFQPVYEFDGAVNTACEGLLDAMRAGEAGAHTLFEILPPAVAVARCEVCGGLISKRMVVDEIAVDPQLSGTGKTFAESAGNRDARREAARQAKKKPADNADAKAKPKAKKKPKRK